MLNNYVSIQCASANIYMTSFVNGYLSPVETTNDFTNYSAEETIKTDIRMNYF